MRKCGLLSKSAIRQIQSDIVTVEALSRLQASEIKIEDISDDEGGVPPGGEMLRSRSLPDEEEK